jgi:hypothetical protein
MVPFAGQNLTFRFWFMFRRFKALVTRGLKKSKNH